MFVFPDIFIILYQRNRTAAMFLTVRLLPLCPGEPGWKDNLSEWLHGPGHPRPRWAPVDSGRCIHRPVLHRLRPRQQQSGLCKVQISAILHERKA